MTPRDASGCFVSEQLVSLWNLRQESPNSHSGVLPDGIEASGPAAGNGITAAWAPCRGRTRVRDGRIQSASYRRKGAKS
jgi:hypothetical protein